MNGLICNSSQLEVRTAPSTLKRSQDPGCRVPAGHKLPADDEVIPRASFR